MNIPEFLRGLKLDAWYKVLIAVGGILFALSLFIPVLGTTNTQLQLLAGGLLLVGSGVEKPQTTHLDQASKRLHGPSRRNH